MSKLRFQELALRHGMLHPDLIELADAKGITGNHDLDTREGREAAVAEFKRRSPGSFKPPESMPIMGAMTHFGNPEGKPSDTEIEVRAEEERLLTRHIEAYAGAKRPEPEKPVRHMTGAEVDAYQRKLEEHHLRAQTAGYQRAEVAKALREIRRGGGL